MPLVENGFVAPQEEITRLVAQRYLAPIRERGVDTLILGCTHYPIISATIRSVMGHGVTLIDSGSAFSSFKRPSLRSVSRQLTAASRPESISVTPCPMTLRIVALMIG